MLLPLLCCALLLTLLPPPPIHPSARPPARRRYRHLQRAQIARGERIFFGGTTAGAIQLGLQVLGVVAVAAYSALMTFVLLFLIDKVMGLRVNLTVRFCFLRFCNVVGSGAQ